MSASPPLPTIVLTGFMGTGKTTVGRLLAAELRLDFVDTDQVIEEEHGPISDIFATQGEDVFRQLEAELAQRLANEDGQVISTGGRMLLDPRNAEALGRDGRIFCLTAEPDELVERLQNGGVEDRPLLQADDPGERIRSLLDERREGYGVFEQIPTDGREPWAIVAEILERLRAQG